MSERYRKLARAQTPVCGVDTHRAETETCCHWYHTHPAWSRVQTKEPFAESDALRLLPDAERVEGSEVVAPVPTVRHAFASGLIRREDGALVPPDR